ncbi:uncharacterized protein LOC121861977 [Homarus americanus]|uniref:uncharacterized protein LOC121861977 n=1 Tax=Homarus americanus TaxID=6706 RepID=UPI001C47110F|nr:uncharacterized protein LOC121861977 [Homarus americanus]
MERLLSACNSGKPVNEFMKECYMRDVIYGVANAWQSVESSTLKNGWHLWPALLFSSAPGEEIGNEFTGFRVSSQNQIVRELLSYAQDLGNPTAKEAASRLDADNINEWMGVDDDESTVHHYTDVEIVQMVVNPETNNIGGESNDENEEEVAERMSIDKLVDVS